MSERSILGAESQKTSVPEHSVTEYLPCMHQALAQSLASLGQRPQVLLASEGLSYSANSLSPWIDAYRMRSASVEGAQEPS